MMISNRCNKRSQDKQAVTKGKSKNSKEIKPKRRQIGNKKIKFNKNSTILILGF